MWGDEAAERHEMDQPSDPLAVDGTPRLTTGRFSATPPRAQNLPGTLASAMDWAMETGSLPSPASTRRQATEEEREAFRALLAQTFTARYGMDADKRAEANALVSAEAERIYGPLQNVSYSELVEYKKCGRK